MTIRAIYSFETIKSTQDLNDRFAKLFSKGIFFGGEISPITNSLSVRISPFRAISSDGMVVIEKTDSIDVNTPANQTTYICLRAVYHVGTEPTLTIETLEESIFNADKEDQLIVFGKVVVGNDAEVNNGMIDLTVRNIIDTVGRLSFRGVLSSLPTPTPLQQKTDVVGDTYIIVEDIGSTPLIYIYDGTTYVKIGDYSNLEVAFNNHINDETSSKHVTYSQKEALAGTTGDPGLSNKYVTETDPKLLTEDQKNSLDGTYGTPSETNKFVTEQQPIAIRTIYSTSTSDENFIEVPNTIGPIFVGTGPIGSARRFFVLEDSRGQGLIDTNGFPIYVTGVFIDNGATPLDPSGGASNNVDADGFWSNEGNSLYLQTNISAIGTAIYIAYGKKDKISNLKGETTAPRILTNSFIYPSSVLTKTLTVEISSTLSGTVIVGQVPITKKYEEEENSFTITSKTEFQEEVTLPGMVITVADITISNPLIINGELTVKKESIFEKAVVFSDEVTFSDAVVETITASGLTQLVDLSTTGKVKMVLPEEIDAEVGELYVDHDQVYLKSS